MVSSQGHYHFPLHVGVILALLLLPVVGHAAGIDIEKASATLQGGTYRLDADIRYRLSDEVLEALNNGIALTFRITIKVDQQRKILWDTSIAEKIVHYHLKYHALSGQYLLTSSEGEQRSYLSLTNTLRGLGQIRALALLDKKHVEAPQDTTVKIKAELDTNALPAPLRPVAWLSRQWKLNSDWYICPLK